VEVIDAPRLSDAVTQPPVSEEQLEKLFMTLS
jgi:hypothetical protein